MMKLAKLVSMINILIAIDVNAGNLKSFSTNDEEKQNFNFKQDSLTNTLSKEYTKESHDNNFSAGRDYKREVQADDKIVRGRIAPEGRYNYIVSLTNRNYDHWCGGSLVAPDVVLSAAHCAKDIEGGIAQVSRYDRSNNEERYEEFQILDIIPHPQYNNRDYDYMLIKLNGQSTNPLIALNGDSDIASSNSDSLTVMGWGRTSYGGPMADKLREVEVKYVTNEVCGMSYEFLGDYEMCASDTDDEGNGKDSCQGDSGGPLIIKGNNVSEDIQVGIVSWGIGCGDVNFPGVYARVSHEIDWIKQTTCDISSSNPSFSCDPQPTLSPTLAPSLSPILATTFLTFHAELDNYPEEIGWQLFELIGEREILREESSIGTYSGKIFEPITDRIAVTPGKYKFSILDDYGDGLNIPGPNAFLYEGPKEEGRLIKSWEGNWGKGDEITFDVHSITPDMDTNHKVTLIIKLDDHPGDISWEIRSKDESMLYASSGEHKYTTKGSVVTEEIPLEPKRHYKLLIKDLGQNGISVGGPNVILYDGKVGVGRVIFKDRGNWGAVSEKMFWLPGFPTESRLIDQRCSIHSECVSGYCNWGRCKNRPTECADSTEKISINNKHGRQFCSYLVPRKAIFCSWQRLKDKCPVTCDACDDT